MINPWSNLPARAPHVLPDDAMAIEAFNRHLKNPHHRIEIDVLPEPFVGVTDRPYGAITGSA